MTKSRNSRSIMGSKLVGIAAVLVIGMLGSLLVTASHAATFSNHNPLAYADYCALEGTSTVLYGWGYDPDTTIAAQPYVNITVGNKTQKVATDRSGYRTAAINKSLTTKYPGAPQGGVYGWRAVFTGLYQGTSNKVSGQVLNYGAGTVSYVALGVNTTSHVDGDATKPYFAGGVVPNTCMPPPPPTVSLSASPSTITKGSASTLSWSSKNASSCTATGNWSGGKPGSGSTSTGALSATSTYALTCANISGSASASATVTVNAPPPASGGSGSGGTHTTTTKTSGNNTATTSALPANNADGTASPGTLGARIKVLTDSASTVHIAFGTASSQLTSSTPDQPAANDPTIELTGLKAKTTYSYAIVRTNSTGSVTSATASFTTKGFTITLAFQDHAGNGVGGIKGSIDDDSKSTATSDKAGNMSFTNLTDGSYTVTFTYKGQEHTLDYSTDSLTGSVAPNDTAVLGDTVDLSQFATSSSSTSSQSHSNVGLVVGVIGFVLLLLGGITFFIIRRRQAGSYTDYLPVADASLAPYQQPSPQQYTPVVGLPASPALPPQTPLPQSPGAASESLRDMVIKSMHEAAAKRTHPPEPPAPGS